MTPVVGGSLRGHDVTGIDANPDSCCTTWDARIGNKRLMPELPEVETVRRGLAPVLVGARITRVEARRPDLRFPLPERFGERLTGTTVMGLERRAKYLIARLSSGEALVMHLGMTGRFTIAAKDHNTTPDVYVPGAYVYGTGTGTDPKHDHVVFHLSGGRLAEAASVVYNDPRRFGFMLMMPEAEREAHALFRNLGTEPLGGALTPDYLAGRARGKKVNLKAFLMDQRIIAGLGNIYVSEALYRAGLSPNRKAASLAGRKGRATDRAARLVLAIQSVLEQAIAAGGSTLRDYRGADGRSGAFQESFAVYNRAGSACSRPDCCGVIKRTIHAGRATYSCSSCQR